MRQSTRGSDLPGAWEPQAGQTSEKRGGKEMAKQAGIDETLRAVRQQLEQTRPQLEVLSGAIWDAINHDDSAALEEGVRFKQSYNERRQQLERAAADMLALLRGWPQSGPGAGTAKPEPAAAVEVPTPPAPTSEPPAATGAPMVQDAKLAPDAKLARALEKKVPFGFVLSGQTFTSASAWPLFYEALLQELYARAPEKISHLADVAAGLQYESNPLFARVPDSLRDPLPIAEALYAEAGLDPPILIEVIKRLIRVTGYSLDSFKILLKEKNRGTVETLSLAA